MPNLNETIINCAVYENGTEYYGLAEVTLPKIDQITESIKGAGIAGEIESVITGHIGAMGTTINFRTVTSEAIALIEPRVHSLDLRVAQQSSDTKSGEISTSAVKYVIKAKPKSFDPGKVAPASAADASGEYSVSYFAMFIDGERKLEIDPQNFIYFINGTDYLEPVRSALGK